MDNESCLLRLNNIIAKLIFKDSYWGYLFSIINKEEDKNLDSPMAISLNPDSTLSLLYNSNFIQIMDENFLKIIVEHEGIHILNNHIPRLLNMISNEMNDEEKSKKIYKWNLASDCSVNTIINIKKQYMMGKQLFEIIHPDNFNLPLKRTAEFYFQNIPSEEENKQNNNSNNNTGNEESGLNSGSNTKNNVKNPSNNKQNKSINIDDHQPWLKNIDKIPDISSYTSRLEEYVNQVVEQSYNNVRERGNLPSYIKEKIEEFLNPPKLPYYQIISKLVKASRLTKQKRAYTRINKKRVYSFFIDQKNLPIISPFPGKTKDFSFNISIIIDTSGSMNLNNIIEALSGIRNIIENDKYCKTTVIEIDVKIQKEYEVKKLKDIQYNISGRGGTRLFPAFSRCKELKSDVTLVFTDGYCDNLNQISKVLLPKRIIYILTNNGETKYIDRTGYIVRLPK